MGNKNRNDMKPKKEPGRHLRVFLLSLVIVVAAGGAALFGYSALKAPRREKAEKEDGRAEIDLDWLTGQADSAGGEKNDSNVSFGEDGIAEGQVAQGLPDETLSEDERLYNEALEKGENVILAECADSGRVTFAFAGDVLLDDGYAVMSNFKSRGGNIDDTFAGGLLERMRGADVFMVNNEFAFSDRGAPIEGKMFTFRANPENAGMYEMMGADIVSLANNHAYDFGGDAMLDTFTTLENAGIPYVGAGRNIDEAKKPLYIVANGMKIGIVSATQIERNGSPDTKAATATSAGVLRCMDPRLVLESIADAKANSDFVILYIHWGTENQAETDWLQNDQAPVYAEAGADLIIGGHPHCLQRIDTVSGVPVIYSLGNFWFNSKALDTCLVEVGINKEGMEYFRFVPCRQADSRTTLLEGAEKDRVLNYMRGLSPRVKIDDEGYVTFG